MRPAAMEMGSMHSLHDLNGTPLPMPPEEKKAIDVKRLSYVLGFLSSSFIIILAVTILSTTALIDGTWTPIITIYITITSVVILFLLILDVKLFTGTISKQVEELRNNEETPDLDHLRQFDEHIEENGRVSGDNDELYTSARFIPDKQELKHIDHNYCFAQGKHAGSVYLKFGAAAFALGHFVHTVLLIAFVHLSIAVSNTECISFTEYVAGLLQCLNCFLQLFFIFNYSNLIILKRMNVLRVALLHVMAGNICLWVAAVATETKLVYKAYEILKKEQNRNNTDTITPAAITLRDFELDDNCRPTKFFARIFDQYSLYLYPFTVEFNTLVVGILFMVWRNIGKCRHSAAEVQNYHHSLYRPSNISGDENSPHALEIHVSCRGAFCGLYSSLFVIVVVIVAIIVSFVLGNIHTEGFQYIAQQVAESMKLVFHTVMLVATGVVFHKTQALDINKHPVPWLDDVLLYICVPAFFLESVLTVIPAITTLNIVKFLDTIIMSLQMIVQIAFIIDGLRRCSNSRKLRRTKPGRELVLFLLVTNVSMWVMYTFEYKSSESKDVRYEYYGKKMWLAIGHLCTPIIMFFRFHSSVCIANIWSYAYKPGIEDH